MRKTEKLSEALSAKKNELRSIDLELAELQSKTNEARGDYESAQVLLDIGELQESELKSKQKELSAFESELSKLGESAQVKRKSVDALQERFNEAQAEEKKDYWESLKIQIDEKQKELKPEVEKIFESLNEIHALRSELYTSGYSNTPYSFYARNPEYLDKGNALINAVLMSDLDLHKNVRRITSGVHA